MVVSVEPRDSSKMKVLTAATDNNHTRMSHLRPTDAGEKRMWTERHSGGDGRVGRKESRPLLREDVMFSIDHLPPVRA